MPRGGPRPGAGRPKGAKNKKSKGKKKDTFLGIKREADNANMTPLEYMLMVMRDPTADDDRRDKMAYYAAPYIHQKPHGTVGKKELQRQKARLASQGKFKPGAEPSKVLRFDR